MPDSFRTINKRPIIWAGHRCEGADAHPGIRLLWTVCGRDVPANHAYLGEETDITCESCLDAPAERPPPHSDDMNDKVLCYLSEEEAPSPTAGDDCAVTCSACNGPWHDGPCPTAGDALEAYDAVMEHARACELLAWINRCDIDDAALRRIKTAFRDERARLLAQIEELEQKSIGAIRFAHEWIGGLPVTPSFQDKHSAQVVLEEAERRVRALAAALGEGK